MLSLLHKIYTYSDGSVQVIGAEPPPIFQHYTGWRCLHVAEGGYQSDNGMPEIRPALPNPNPVRFTAALQRMSYSLNRHNPLFTTRLWRAVYGTTVAFTNGNGFPGRRDYVNMLDLEAEYPKLMKALICGGMFIKGDVDGKNLICRPGIHGIDANQPIPPIETVLANSWYFAAVTQYNGQVSHFPQGKGSPVLIPYVLRETVSYPLDWFTPWKNDYPPDPLKVYQPIPSAH